MSSSAVAVETNGVAVAVTVEEGTGSAASLLGAEADAAAGTATEAAAPTEAAKEVETNAASEAGGATATEAGTEANAKAPRAASPAGVRTRSVMFAAGEQVVEDGGGALVAAADEEDGDDCSASGSDAESEDWASGSEGGDEDEGDAPPLDLPKGLLAHLLTGDTLGSKPLHAAAAADDAAEIGKLLGEDGELKGSVDDLDPFHYTALHVAAEAGSCGAIRALFEKGADGEAQTKMHMSRPLHYAAFEGHAEACQALVDGGCDVDPRTDDLRTPLYQAAFRGHSACVKVLLDAGADKNVASKDGKTARDVAEADEVKELLDSRSAVKKARVEPEK